MTDEIDLGAGEATAAAWIAKFLQGHGVDRVFGLQGGHIQPIWDWLGRLGIRIVDVRDEGAAVHMAHAHAELTGGFLAAAGAGPDELRARAAEPEFLGFVLDFLLANEPALLAFAEAEGVKPDLPMRARAALPGGDLPNWT